MPADDRSEFEAEYTDFVPAVFARSAEDAEIYRELLDDHDIPAIVGDPEEDGSADGRKGRAGMTHGVPVLVPEALLDEASEIIADREDSDEFVAEEDELEEEDEEEDEKLGLGEEVELEDPFADDEDEDEDDDEEDEDEEDLLDEEDEDDETGLGGP
ncbi:MAG: hypothetical protein WC869_11640 [Phycisphaerae bacterium]|jgi:hypothetical protein